MASATSPLRQVQPEFPIAREDDWSDVSDEEMTTLDALAEQAERDADAGLLEPYKPL
jgi:hypothetical protein